MKYTNLKNNCFNFNGLDYYCKGDMRKGGPVDGGIYSNSIILDHVSIQGDDYVEFTPGYYVKVDDMYNRSPYDERLTFSNQISYEIY